MNVGQVHSLREVLSQEPVSVFVGAALPRVLRITEENLDVCGQAKAFVVRHLFAAILGE